MSAFVAFCKKEIQESIRTYKFFIMLITFVLLGMMSPVVAKIIPDILSASDLGNITIIIPEPTAMDSWVQFFSNIGQMGILVLVIVFSGITANELSKGTLINILTKGMKRRTIILSKFTVAVGIWIISYGLSLAVAYGYTIYFWGNDQLPYAFLAFSAPLLYGMFLISLMILGGICFKNFYGSLLSVGGAIVVMSLLNISPTLHKYNPISLSGGTLSLLNGQKIPADFIPALLMCFALTIFCLVMSVVVFDRKQI